MRTFLLSFVLFFIWGAASSLFACDEQKVSVGQTRGEVEVRCGKPTWKEKAREEPLQRKHKGRRTTQIVEEWFYNLGPREFIRILRFREGKLESIQTGEYGWTEGGPVDFGCERTSLSNGASKAEVRGRCGKPTSAPRAHGKSGREEWLYNLGPTQFVRIYIFENGRLVESKTGGYGK